MAGMNVASLARLVEQFEQLPGIGHKTAQRLAFHVLSMTDEQADRFAAAITDAHKKIRRCSVCCNLAEQEQCPICSAPDRDRSVICVVEDPRDVIAIEKTREYRGVYHVLHGVISPLNGIGPEDITVKQLIARMDDSVSEVIMATNPTVEGEATAMYISRLLKPLGVTVTRLAYGVPVGAELESADEVTLTRALEGRRKL